MDWKCPYILLLNRTYRARPGCIGIHNTLFCSFCEFPVAYIWTKKGLTPLGACILERKLEADLIM